MMKKLPHFVAGMEPTDAKKFINSIAESLDTEMLGYLADGDESKEAKCVLEFK